MAIELTDLALPSEVLTRIQERKQKLTAEDEFLIGKGAILQKKLTS